MVQCSRGHENPDSQAFCGACGERLGPGPDASDSRSSATCADATSRRRSASGERRPPGTAEPSRSFNLAQGQPPDDRPKWMWWPTFGHVDWGTLPSWVAAVGTVGAFFVPSG
jgi:hypothetical protein